MDEATHWPSPSGRLTCRIVEEYVQSMDGVSMIEKDEQAKSTCSDIGGRESWDNRGLVFDLTLFLHVLCEDEMSEQDFGTKPFCKVMKLIDMYIRMR